jgi:hypothetical protein
MKYDLLRVPADLVDKLERLIRAGARFEVQVDDVCCLLRDINRGLGPSRSSVDQSDAALKLPALGSPVWIESIRASARSDGWVDVVLNGNEFELPPHLGALLLALLDDSGVGPDGAAAFKTLDDIAVRMSKRIGWRSLSRETVNKYLWKLRKILTREAALPRSVIQTHRYLGRRLAIRKRS